MSDDEFALFLRRLDTGILGWKKQLSQIDTGSLGLEQQEGADLARSYGLCLRSLDNARKEIDGLSQKQTLKLDFLLLVDLNDLARNLDELTRDLMDVNGGGRAGVARKSLDYARGALGTDAALTPYLAEFQRHVLAVAGMIDAAREQTDDGTDSPKTQNEIGPLQGSGNYTKPIKEQLR
jgi:hypothetical protein